MAAWLPILKAALPYVGNIVAAALPVFTARREQDAATEVVSRQIVELQEAVTGNAETVKELATQLEHTITAIATGQTEQDQRWTTLQEALARCESASNLALARVTRLEEMVADSRALLEQVEPRANAASRREIALAATSLLALVMALLAYLG